MKNFIKATAVAKDVPLFKIAERLNMKPSNFSALIKNELPEEKAKYILQVIDELSAEGGHE